MEAAFAEVHGVTVPLGRHRGSDTPAPDTDPLWLLG